jgi:Ca-activated chloride channel family protein
MLRWSSLRIFVQVMLLASIALAADIHSSGSEGVRVCVIAVHDSGLFTMCPSGTLIKQWGYAGRTPNLEIIQNPEGPRLGLPPHLVQLDRPVLDRTRAGWWSIIGKLPGNCPSGKIDLDLKNGIEKEFVKQGNYQIADSADTADLVFLAEGLYADASSGFVGAQAARSRSAGIPMLALVMAVVVPAKVFTGDPGDSDILLDARLWEGTEAWKSAPAEVDRLPASVPAALDRLVSHFIHRDGGQATFPPLCAPRILVPSVDGTGMPRAEAQPKNAILAAPAPSGNPAAAPARDSVIRVNVSLVTVPTIVSDTAGKHVPDVPAQDFHVFEDGIEQPIDRVIPEVTPFHVVLMLDTSGSTLFRHSEIQQAALAFVQTLRPEDRVMVVSFDSYIYLDAAFTNDRAALRRAILKTDTGAGTRMYDALDMVLTECLTRVQGRKAIVLFTDGVDSQSWLARFGNYQSKVEESDALVYAVQFDTMEATSASQYLKGLSENSGGRLFLASSIPSLAGAFAEIADELQHQYTICYYPSSPGKDATFRRIQVTVDKPDTKIRARTGYRITRRSPQAD